jgi:hypothetical protein
MFFQDLMIVLRETAAYSARQQLQPSCTSLPCGCAAPGQETQCEDCPHLEACLSRAKLRQLTHKHC